MPSGAFIPSIPIRPYQQPRRHSRTRICRTIPSLCAKPPHRNETLPVPVSTGQLARPFHTGLPTLFKGPEAVLGVLLAAAALLADFAKGLARITASRGEQSKEHVEEGLEDVDRSIALLRAALDESKRALKVTEDDLDDNLIRANSAEKALAGLGDSRDKLVRALDDAAKAEVELERIQSYLAEEFESTNAVQEKRELVGAEMVRVEGDVRKRENEVEEIRQLLDDVRRWGKEKLDGYAQREDELKEGILERETEVEGVRKENERLNEEVLEMEKRAGTMAEQVSAAALALEETRRELERVQKELDERKEESVRLEVRSDEIEKNNTDAENLRMALHDMETELRDLQIELRERDMFVDTVAHESDELRSLLATRDAELRDVSQRLVSALEIEKETGGDSRQSDLKLEEIKSNLEAEQMAYSAEIAKAELAKSDITEENLDVMDRVSREMNAEGDLLQAGLRKAEATVLLEEHQQSRKEGAVNDILESLEAEDDDTELSALLEQTDTGSKERKDAAFVVDGQEAGTIEGEQDLRPGQPLVSSVLKGDESEIAASSKTDNQDYFVGDKVSSADISSEDLNLATEVISSATPAAGQAPEAEAQRQVHLPDGGMVTEESDGGGEGERKMSRGSTGQKKRGKAARKDKNGADTSEAPKRKRGRPRKRAG